MYWLLAQHTRPHWVPLTLILSAHTWGLCFLSRMYRNPDSQLMHKATPSARDYDSQFLAGEHGDSDFQHMHAMTVSQECVEGPWFSAHTWGHWFSVNMTLTNQLQPQVSVTLGWCNTSATHVSGSYNSAFELLLIARMWIQQNNPQRKEKEESPKKEVNEMEACNMSGGKKDCRVMQL